MDIQKMCRSTLEHCQFRIHTHTKFSLVLFSSSSFCTFLPWVEAFFIKCWIQGIGARNQPKKPHPQMSKKENKNPFFESKFEEFGEEKMSIFFTRALSICDAWIPFLSHTFCLGTNCVWIQRLGAVEACNTGANQKSPTKKKKKNYITLKKGEAAKLKKFSSGGQEVQLWKESLRSFPQTKKKKLHGI